MIPFLEFLQGKLIISISGIWWQIVYLFSFLFLVIVLQDMLFVCLTLDILRTASVWRVKEAHDVFIRLDSCTLVCQLLSLLFQQLQLGIKEKQTGKNR